MYRKGGVHLVADRPHDPIGVFGLQQTLDEPARRLDARFATRAQLLPSESYAAQGLGILLSASTHDRRL